MREPDYYTSSAVFSLSRKGGEIVKPRKKEHSFLMLFLY